MVGGEFGVLTELFTDDDEEAGDRVNEAMNSVGGDSERTREQADNNVEEAEGEVDRNEKVAGGDDNAAARGGV